MIERKLLNRISITGSESTAKSWLTVELAKYYKACRVDEYSREFLSENNIYTETDIIKIAKEQLSREEIIASGCDSLVFCDTDVLVNKIWSTYVYQNCDPWIEKEFINHEYGLYLLCAPDIEWEYDPLRENPDNRQEIFILYENALKDAGFNYKIISGQGNKRLQNAVKAVDTYLLNKY